MRTVITYDSVKALQLLLASSRPVALDIKTYLLLKAAEKSPATRAVPVILYTSCFEPVRLCDEIIRVKVENAHKFQPRAGYP